LSVRAAFGILTRAFLGVLLVVAQWSAVAHGYVHAHGPDGGPASRAHTHDPDADGHGHHRGHGSHEDDDAVPALCAFHGLLAEVLGCAVDAPAALSGAVAVHAPHGVAFAPLLHVFDSPAREPRGPPAA
jgi:hypothetical protein